MPSFSQAPPETAHVTEAEKTALLAENATLKQQIKDSAAAAQTAALAAARADGLAFADSLVAQDRLATDHRDAVAELFASLATAEQTQGAVLQYGAADARAPLLPVVKQLLGGLPVRVLGQRQATTGRAAGAEGDAADGALAFSAPPGAIVRPERTALLVKANAYITAHPGTEFAAACRAVGA